MVDQTVSIPSLQSYSRERMPTSALSIQYNVFYALVLHDIKTRFFGNIWGYIATIVWPALHLAFLILIHVLHLTDSYGDSVVLFAATGVMPFISWNYIARFSMLGQITNRALLNYPIVNPIDLIISRTFLEMTTVFIILIGLLSFMILIDVNVMPLDLGQAALGFLSAIVLGIGFGLLCGTIAPWFPFISFLWMFFMIIAHLFSGIAIPVESMPQQVQQIIAYNPLLHSVEWIRSAYWNDYPTHLLSKSYVYLFGGSAAFIGLALERMLRKNLRVRL